MPRLKPTTQAARRENILDAAERCFARAGFHGTSMHDICSEAGVSPGALYVYFASKERLISGIAERDRKKLQRQLEDVATAPDLVSALQRLADHYMLEEPAYKRALIIEIGAESTRNPTIAAICQATNRAVQASFLALLERARAQGKIQPALDLVMLNSVIQILGDGLFWRRAVDPEFDVRQVMPAVMMLITGLMSPTTAVDGDAAAVGTVRGGVAAVALPAATVDAPASVMPIAPSRRRGGKVRAVGGRRT